MKFNKQTMNVQAGGGSKMTVTGGYHISQNIHFLTWRNFRESGPILSQRSSPNSIAPLLTSTTPTCGTHRNSSISAELCDDSCSQHRDFGKGKVTNNTDLWFKNIKCPSLAIKTKFSLSVPFPDSYICFPVVQQNATELSTPLLKPFSETA
jgi:hypothetical protein